MDEMATRLVPWHQIEVTWARNRPHHERPPLPVPGDRVWYRRHEWDHDDRGTHHPTELATVLEVQPLDDQSDPNLWQQVRDVHGDPVYDAGMPRFAPVADPWPVVFLRPESTPWETVGTREARLRGSAGWLPVDYRSRAERWRLPEETRGVPRPALPLLSGPTNPLGG